MGDDDGWYLEALHNYLNSSEWRDTIRVFVLSHCYFFSDVSDLHPQQYVIWKSFQEVAENILEMALINVGGSIDQLERSIDKLHAKPSRGPRDETIKEVLSQLMSFDDFQVFSRMMHQACEEEIGDKVYDMNNNHHNLLMRMGFTVERILTAMDQLGDESTLEDLIALLGDESVGRRSPAKGSTKASYAADAKSTAPSSSAVYSSPPSSSRRSGELDYDAKSARLSAEQSQYPLPAAINNFIDEAAEYNHAIFDYDELRSRFRVAESLLNVYKETSDFSSMDSRDLGRVGISPSKLSLGDEGMNSDSMLDLVKWAAEMQVLLQDMHTAYHNGISCKEPTLHHPKGLIAAYQDLENAFEVINKGNFVTSNELERLRELDSIAAGHSEEEQYLYSCISNYEAVSKEVSKLYKKCSIITMTNPDVDSQDLETIYLFLKDQITDDQSSNNNEHIYANLQSNPVFHKLHRNESGVECVQLLLDLHLLEEEMKFLKEEIQRLVGASPTRGGDGGSGGGGGRGGFDDGDKLSFSSNGLEGMNFSLLDDLVGMDSSLLAADSKTGYEPASTSAEKISSKDTPSSLTIATPSHTPPLVSASLASGQHDHLLDNLKAGHRSSITQLKNLLNQNKDRALQALEERLMRKKLLKRNFQERRGGGGEEDEKVEEDEIAELSTEIASLEAQIDQANSTFALTNGYLLEGYRDKCVHELKEAKALLERSIQDGSIHHLTDMKQALASHPALQTNINNTLLASIQNRYIEERDKLLASLEMQQRQRRDKLGRLIQARKARGDEAWIAQEEAAFEEGLRQELLHGMSRITEEYVYHNAARSLEPALLQASLRESADDGYLDDVTGPRRDQEAMTSYLHQVEAMKKAYEHANANLYDSLLAKRWKGRKGASSNSREGGGVGDESDTQLADKEAIEVMTSVIMEACDNHLREALSSTVSSLRGGTGSRALSSTPPSQEDVHDRARVGILEAFEKAKVDLHNNHSHSRAMAQARLAARKKAQAKDSAPTDANLDESLASVEERLETAVDVFLQVPPPREEVEGEGSIRRKGESRWRDDKESTFGDDLDKQRKDRLRAMHSDRHKALEDGLYTDMLDKKRKLEDRIRRKREQEASLQDTPSHREEEDHADDGFNSTQASFDPTEAMGSASLDREKGLETLPALRPRPVLPPLGSASSPPVDYTSEARRITYAYTEEKEKHDLLMKIQETRQRQHLQKKLWQRHHNRQHHPDATTHPTGAAAEEEEEDSGHKAGEGARDRIVIGQFQSRVPSQRGNLQPAAKGLSLNKIASFVENRQANAMMAMRGLNLAPLQRK